MKTLLLMRHAKSSWADPGLADHDRPLNKRGRRAAPRMGRWLIDQQLWPEWVISSTAERAVQTTAALLKQQNQETPWIQESRLYHATPDDIATVLREIPTDIHRAMIVGHNPEFEQFLTLLVGHYETLPTAAVAVVELPIRDWLELQLNHQAELVHFWKVKELPEER